MREWLGYAVIAIVFWGVVGLLQKMGSNRISARGLIVWLTAGFCLWLPFLWFRTGLGSLNTKIVVLGVVGGFLNGLGSWALFKSLEAGAKASVAIPLTALYPLVTAMLAVVFLKERLTVLEWAAVFLALAAGAMLSYESPAKSAGASQ